MDTEEDDKSCIIERLDSCEASNPQSSDSGEEPDCTVNEYSTRNYFTSSGIFNCFRSGDKSLSKSVDKIDNSGEDDELTTLGDIDASVAHTELAVASANNTQCEDAFGINYNTHIGEPNRKNDSKKDAEDCSVVSKLETSDKITECDLPNNEHSEISHMACGKDSFAETVKEEIKECEMNEDMKSDIACSAVSRSMDEQTADSYNQCQPNKVGGEHGHIVNSKTFNSTAIGDTNKSTQTVEISDTSQCSLTFDQCLKIKKTRSFNDKTECDENITATGDSVMNQSIEKGMDFHSETTTSENRYQKPKTEDLNSSSLKMMPKTYFTTATDATNTHESHTGVTFTSECAAKKETKDTSTLIGLGFSNGILTSDVGQKQLHCGLATSTPESVTPSTSFTNNTNSIMYEGATGLFGTVSDQDLTKLRQLSLQPMKPPELSSYKPVPLFSESFTSSSTVPSLPLLLPPVSSFQLEPNYSSNSSVGDSQNLHLSPKFANANNSLQNSAEKTKVSFSFPLKSTQNTGFGESSVFSNMPASKNTPAVNVPLKYATGDSEINNISDSSTDKPSFNFCPGNPSFPPPIFGKHLDTGNAGPVTATPGFAFRFATPFKVVNSSVDINTNTATGNIPKLDVKCPKSDNIVGTFGQNIFFSGVTKQPESSSFNFGKIGLNITTAETNNFSSSPTFSFGSIARASEENSESSKSGDLFGSKPLPQSDCKSKETNRMLFNSFGMKDKDVPQFTWNSPKEKTTLPVPVTASLSTLFSFGSVQGQNTSNSFSALNSSPSSKPFPSTPSNSFSSGSVFNRFSIGVSSPATSSTVMFNFKASDKKLKQKSSRVVTPAQLKLRIQKPTPNKSEIPFRVVTEADTYVKNGITYSITSHHQHITAMPEYSSLSFEELRLQYAKYNVNQPTETKTTTANKKIQTTESLWEIGNHLMEMWKILECPVCLEIVSSPVLQCERGHHVCNQCWKRVPSCPLCKRYRSTTRNYVAEAMVEKLPLPCKYRVDGCMKTMPQTEKIAHEETCLFRTYTCLVDNCNQAHSYVGMTVHLKNSHSHLIFGSPFHIPKGHKFTRTMTKHAFQSLVQAFDIPGWGLFFLCHKVSGKNTCLWMQAICTGTSESQFLYSVEVADINGLRSVSYKGPVLPLHRVVGENEQDCLIVTDTLLGTLKKNYGFHIKISIWRSESLP